MAGRRSRKGKKTASGAGASEVRSPVSAVARSAAAQGGGPLSDERLAMAGGATWLLVLFLVGCALTWRRWPDIQVDWGNQVMAAFRALDGILPQTGSSWVYGPGAVLLNAALAALCGKTLSTFLISSAILALGFTLGLMAFFRARGSLAAGVLAGTTFLGVFCFGHYVGNGNYTYLAPYSYEALYGTYLNAALAALLLVQVSNPRPGLAFVAGLAAGAITTTETELVLAGGLVTAVGWALAVVRCGWSPTLRPLLAFVGGALVPVLAVFSVYRMDVGSGEALQATFNAIAMVFRTDLASNPNNVQMTGLNTPAASLADVGFKLLWLLLVLVPAFWLARRAPAGPGGLWRGAVCAVLGFVPFLSPRALDVWSGPFALWSLAAIGVGLVALPRWRRMSREEFDFVATTLVLGVLAFGFILRMILKAHIYHYGFFQALPAALLSIWMLAAGVPRWGRFAPSAHRVWLVFVSAAVLGACWCGVQLSKGPYRFKTQWIGSGSSRMAFYDARADWRSVAVPEFLKWAEGRIGPEQTMLVLPEGGLLNVWTGAKNPTRYNSGNARNIDEFDSSAKVLESLRSTRPDYIVLMQRDFSEYRSRFFGADGYLGEELEGWILKQYRRVWSIGPGPYPDNQPGIQVLQRKEG